MCRTPSRHCKKSVAFCGRRGVLYSPYPLSNSEIFCSGAVFCGAPVCENWGAVVAVAGRTSKTPLFTVAERIALLTEVMAGVDRVEIRSFDGLLADFAHEVGAGFVVRGLRAVSDFEYEFQMALMNRKLRDDLETVFLVPARHLTFLSSSLVREVASLGGDVADLVHPAVHKALQAKFT